MTTLSLRLKARIARAYDAWLDDICRMVAWRSFVAANYRTGRMPYTMICTPEHLSPWSNNVDATK